MANPQDFAYIPSSSSTFDDYNAFHAMEHPQQLGQPPLQAFSDEDMSEPGPSSKMPRRGTRACDRCRKIKSKCEGSEGDRCKNCVAAGTPCTFQGPSFKRGPPKGYIHAIEQRWHQVECILATMMALPRTQDVVAELRADPFARDILDRVETGPYGSVGRSTRTSAHGQQGFYNTIMNQAGSEDRRSKRQSRQTREFVSNQEGFASTVPTAEWQEQLYRRLSGGTMSGIASPSTQYSASSSSDVARLHSYSSSSGQTSPVAMASNMPGLSGQPGRRRRRLLDVEGHVPSGLRPIEDDTLRRSLDSTAPLPGEEYDEAIDAFGHLSVDQNQEFRYHGRSAGLHLLAKSDRTDDSEQTENGIWKFDNPKMEAECRCLSFDQVNDRVELPDTNTQDLLITVYFTYVHHFYPVVHKASFLATYYERSLDVPSKAAGGENKREPIQTVTKLLLLSMFSVAARYLPVPDGKSHAEAGNDYALDARRLLNTIFEDSRPSVCQALLLLGMREFGVGCISQGWMYVGMGCRMAIDLGMNRDADKWKDATGKDLFSPIEKQIRRQIWWSCCIADKMSAVWLGRPVTFRQGDFNTAEPDFDLNDDEELWRPYPRDALGPNFVPMPARVMSCFKEQCKLSFIISELMVKLYPVRLLEEAHRRRRFLDDLEARLHQWLINLPEELQFREGGPRPLPAPHVVILHIEYHAAILLLHRAFLPNWSDHQRFNTEHDHDVEHNKCLDICQAAASRISSLIQFYDSSFSLKHAPPLTSSFLQSAGIMHVVTLTRRPRDTQATIGLIQSIQAAEALQEVWPEASRVRSLLKGAKVQMDDLVALSQTAERPKRDVEQALGVDRNSDLLMRYGVTPTSRASSSTSTPSSMQSTNSPYGMYANAATTTMQPEQSTISFIPGYEWWPQLVGPGTGGGFTNQEYDVFQPPPLGSQIMPPQGLFTFDGSQITSDFMHNVGVAGANIPEAQQPQQPHQQPHQPHQPQHHQHHQQHQRRQNDPNMPSGSGSQHHYGLGYPRQ